MSITPTFETLFRLGALPNRLIQQNRTRWGLSSAGDAKNTRLGWSRGEDAQLRTAHMGGSEDARAVCCWLGHADRGLSQGALVIGFC